MVAQGSELTLAGERRGPLVRMGAIRVSRDLLALAGVLALAAAFNVWRLTDNGYGNVFYAASVRSMTLSWKNFFFGAFDPGGYITVDKPPVFLWFGALSARLFGYSQWSILLPSAVAGTASVGLLWAIVRRYFGLLAATVAAVVLALTPVSVAVNRLNLPEPFMILMLVGAAGAVMQSVESRRWWWWIGLAGVLVGLAFNTKMLAAWIPGPALALAVVVGARAVSWRTARSIAVRLALLAAVTVAVSASWMVIVDRWPASDRPYIGGSTNNTVLDLALGYNGFGRVDGDEQGGGGGGPRAAAPAFRTPSGAMPRFNGQAPFAPRGNSANRPPANAAPPPNAGTGGFRGPGGIFGGSPSWLRMFDDANGGQIGWLLPFAIGSGLLALWWWRRDPARRAMVVLFAGWIALYGGVFSYAQGIFHSYYTSAMAPGVAALAGIGALAMVEAVRRDRMWLIAVALIIGVTAWVQFGIADREPSFYGWVRPPMLLAVAGGMAAVAWLAVTRRSIAAGVGLAMAGLLLLPASWSASVTANESLNTTLPQAGPQQGASGGTFGSQAFDSGTDRLATWLLQHRDGATTWDLVVANSQGASRLIAQYGLSVMSLGGFLGSDNTTTVAQFADRVADGSVRYVDVTQTGRVSGIFGRGRGGTAVPAVPRNSAGAVMAAVQQACKQVPSASTPAGYEGSLYDCAGAAAALRAAGG